MKFFRQHARHSGSAVILGGNKLARRRKNNDVSRLTTRQTKGAGTSGTFNGLRGETTEARVDKENELINVP